MTVHCKECSSPNLRFEPNTKVVICNPCGHVNDISDLVIKVKVQK